MNLTIFYTVYDGEPIIHDRLFDEDYPDVLLPDYRLDFPCCEYVTIDLVKFLKVLYGS